MDRHLPARLTDSCILVSGLSWRESGATKQHEDLYGTPPSSDQAKGSWSPGQRTGSVVGNHEALLFDVAAPRKVQGRPFKLTNMGLQFSGARLYLTGEIRRARSLTAAAPARQRLALIAHPRLLSGPQQVTGKPPVPNTFLFAVQGDATITKALAAALGHARCKGRFARGRPIRAGAALGQITTQLLPRAGTGLGGTVDIGGGLRLIGDEDGVEVVVTPSGGPTRLTVQSGEVLRFVLPPGTATPLTCNLGLGCYPARGGFALPGQLALSYGGRTTVLDDLTVAYAPTGGELPSTVVSGTLDGAPVTIANDPDNPNTLADDFTARVGAALGTTVGGTIGEIEPRFTATGPL